MKYATVQFEKKVSDGNYGTTGYTVSATLEEGDNIDQVMQEVSDKVLTHLGLKPVPYTPAKE